jgi:hypothetical protein
MSTFSDKTVYHGYHHKDDPHTLVTGLYESKGGATSELYTEMSRKGTGVKWADFEHIGNYNARYRAHRKADRAVAKKMAGDDYVLVTYHLVRN